MRAKRIYNLRASKPGVIISEPGTVIVTDARIKWAAVIMFRRYFGRCPDRHVWGWEGQMASAMDRRGNRVHLDQINRNPPEIGYALVRAEGAQ